MIFPNFIIDEKHLTPKQVLFFYEIPVLFVCNNDIGEFFLAYCADIDELQYSIAKVEKQSLIQMLDNEISMDSLFKKASKKWNANVILFDQACTAESIECFEEDNLPKKGAIYGSLDPEVEKFLHQIKFNNSFEVKHILNAQFILNATRQRIQRKNFRFNNDSDIVEYSIYYRKENIRSKEKSTMTTKLSYKKEDLICAALC